MKRVGIAVLGLGWMGQAHSRAAMRLPSLFPDRGFDPDRKSTRLNSSH